MRHWKTALIALLTLGAGTSAYLAAGYGQATLVIRARAYADGQRQLLVRDGDSGTSRRVDYTLTATGDETSFYPIELPRVRLAAISIPPLAPAGQYQLDGLSLTLGSTRYSWDEDLACTQEEIPKGMGTDSACSAGAPQISPGDDGTVAIDAIAGDALRTPPGKRLMIALGGALVAFLAAVFVIRPRSPAATGSGSVLPVRLAWLTVVLLYLLQLYQLASHAVDIPYWEEWEFFGPDALSAGLTWQWLTSQLCHQRMMAFTKFMAWLNFRLFSLNFVVLKLMNYLVFGGILLALARFQRGVQREGGGYFPFFLLFLLSPLAYEVHVASFQNGETAVVLCSVIMLIWLTGVESSPVATLLFCLAAVGALCSLSAGLVYTLVFLLCGTAFALAGRGGKGATAPWRGTAITWLVLVPCLLFWFADFKKPDAAWGLPEWLLPLRLKFWEKYFDLLGYVFGFESESLLPGVVCLLLVLAPVVMLLRDREKRRQAASAKVITAIAGTLAVIGLLVVGRGNMVYGIRVSRYVIFGYLLIPYTAMAWSLALPAGRRRLLALTFFWCFCAAAYMNDWDYRIYRDVRQIELNNLECAAAYSRGDGDGNCPGTYLFPIGRFIDGAKSLGIHFAGQLPPPNGAPR